MFAQDALVEYIAEWMEPWMDDPQLYDAVLWVGWGSASFVVVVVIGWWLHKRRQWRREWEEAKKAWDDSKN